MTVYGCIKDYLDTCTEVKDKIIKLNIIINAMYDSAERAAESGEFEEYTLDDGQSKIRSTYRSVKDIIESIKGYEALKMMYTNRLQGRSVVLVDKYSNRF